MKASCAEIEDLYAKYRLSEALMAAFKLFTDEFSGFDIITIPELKNTKSLTAEQQKRSEGELILRQLQTSDHLVLLDEHGKTFRSIDFADWIQKKQNTVSKRLVFVIGGPFWQAASSSSKKAKL